MLFELKLAARFIRSRRRSLVRFTSIAAVAGIASGVASLILAQALARGFQSEMQEKILANTAHVSIFRQDHSSIENWQAVKTAIAGIPNVERVEAANYKSALVTANGSVNYAILRVAETRAEGGTSGPDSPPRIAIGAELALSSGLRKGDKAEIILPAAGSSRTITVIINDVFNTGLYEYDSTWIKTTMADYLAISGEGSFAPSVLNVSLNNAFDAEFAAANIKQQLNDENFRVLAWQEANRPLFAALSLERKAALAVILLIIVIAALNITTTLSMLVNERRADIAVLRTYGATTKTLLLLFVLQGAFLGALGIIFGVIIGVVGCWLGNYFRVVGLSAEVYSLSFIPFRTSVLEMLAVAAIADVLSLAATIYPAYMAVRIKPLENLRNP